MCSSNTSGQESLASRLHLPPPDTFISYQTDAAQNQPTNNLELPPLNLAPIKPKARSDRTPWTSEEDNLLRFAVQIYGDRTDKWTKIAAYLPGRTNKNCRKRWYHSLNPDLRKGAWTAEEDDLLFSGYARFKGRWSKIAEMIPGRTDDQCAKRWRESLNPEIYKQDWTLEEDELLQQKYAELGSQWQKIAAFFPGRPGLHCRNRWRKIQRNSQNRKEVSLASSTMEESSTKLATLEETLINPQMQSITITMDNESPSSNAISNEISQMSLVDEDPLGTSAILKEMTVLSAAMEETLATSTASSDPSIASLLSPSLPANKNSRALSQLVERSSASLPPIFSFSIDQNQKDPEVENDHSLKRYGCGAFGCDSCFPNSNGLYYHMKAAHPHVSEVDRPYRCAISDCTKRYKNINGLEYHIEHAKGSSGHQNDGSEEADSQSKPYKCVFSNCKKSYKNVNGLQYHLSHIHADDIMKIGAVSVGMSRRSSNPQRKHSNTSIRPSNVSSSIVSNSQTDIMNHSLANVNTRPFQMILPRPAQ